MSLCYDIAGSIARTYCGVRQGQSQLDPLQGKRKLIPSVHVAEKAL